MTKEFDFEVVFSEVARFIKYRLLDPEFLFLVIKMPSSIGYGKVHFIWEIYLLFSRGQKRVRWSFLHWLFLRLL